MLSRFFSAFKVLNIQVYLAIFIIWLLAASLWGLQGLVVPWDSKNHFYPMFRFLGASLQAAEWPLWNPYHFAGHPTVADPQSLLFTPTLFFGAWLYPTASMTAFDLMVYAHLLIGGLAVAAWGLQQKWHPLAVILAATVFMLGGSASGRLQHTGMIISYAFLPVVLLSLEKLLSQPRIYKAILFGIASVLLALGRDQVAYLSVLTVLAYLIWRIWTHTTPLIQARRLLPYLGLAALISAALGTMPMLLTLDFLSGSTRPEIAFGVAAQGSLPPASLLMLLIPNLFGALRWTYDYWGPSPAMLLEGTWTDRSIQYVFVGTLPIVLLVWGMLRQQCFQKEGWFFGGIFITSLIYSVGWYTPVFEKLFDYFAGVALYRRPADATFIMGFSLAYLSGFLLNGALQNSIPKTQPKIYSAVVLLGLAGVVFFASKTALHYAVLSNQQNFMLFQVSVSFLSITACAFILWLMPRKPIFKNALALSLVLFTAGELIMRNAASSLNSEPAARYTAFSKLSKVHQQGLAILKAELAENHARFEYPRVEILGLTGAWQNASMVFEIENTLGYNPLRLANYEKIVGVAENAFDPNVRHFPETFRGYSSRIAALLGIEYLLLPIPLGQLPAHMPQPDGANLLYGEGDFWLYRLSGTAPRLIFATQLFPIDTADILGGADLPPFDFRTEALIDARDVPLLKGDYAIKDTTTDPDPARVIAQIHGYRRNAVIASVETDRRGILVLHDLSYAGWAVYVNGEQKPLLRTNLLFRGVELEAGQHRVEFKFEPFSKENLRRLILDLRS
jgi:hypothetical protein